MITLFPLLCVDYQPAHCLQNELLDYCLQKDEYEYPMCSMMTCSILSEMEPRQKE